jgi:NADPH:quinone reductase
MAIRRLRQTMNKMQKALLLRSAGVPLISVANHPIPSPNDTQVQVKVTVAGLNGHDQKIRDMGIFLGSIGTPAVLASDVVGAVISVGKEVTSLREGDRIVSQAEFSHGTFQNGLQEYAVLTEEFSAKIPTGISDDDAATLPTNLIAALVAIFHDLPIPAPWTEDAKTFDYGSAMLLIIGGGSYSGRYATQLAKLAGIGKIVVVGGAEEELKRYGATSVIDRHGSQEDLYDQIRAVVGDELIYAYDAVNMPAGQMLGINALSGHRKGYFTRLLPLPIDTSQVSGKEAGFEVRGVLGTSTGRPQLSREFWRRLPMYLESGSLRPIQDGFAVTNGLVADEVNKILDTFKDAGKKKHAHVHL